MLVRSRGMRRPTYIELSSGAVLLLTGATVLCFAAGWHSPVRTGIALAFLLLAPGWALTDLLAVRDPLRQLALATSASLAIETLASLALLYAGAFSTVNGLAAVAALTILAVTVTLVRDLLRQP